MSTRDREARRSQTPLIAAPALFSWRLLGLLALAAVLAGGQADAVASLIAAAEGQYNHALDLYKSGQFEAARLGFDAAVDQIVSGPFPVRDTPPLQAELDRLLDRIQALEIDALQSGNGFNDHQPQVAPIDRVPPLTFPLDPATRAQLTRELPQTGGDLPITLNDPVLRYVRYFTTVDRSDLILGLRRAGRYQAMVESIFKQEGVPTDLMYVAQAESDFDTLLVSPAGARGMWQFMAARSDDYGLQRTAWVDERQDPEKATRAAARHLKDLHAEFGDWYLAMAAYNTGPGTMRKIIAKAGTDDFWTLYDRNELPHYVRNYIPIILATALIAKNPGEYGLADLVVDPPDQVDTVKVLAPLDLRLAADCAATTTLDLQRLNPSLLHLHVPAGFDLKLPRGSLAQFQQGLALVPAAQRLNWRLHWMRPGETLPQIAARFHLTLARLQAANPPPLAAALVLPLPPAPTPAPQPAKKPGKKPGPNPQ